MPNTREKLMKIVREKATELPSLGVSATQTLRFVDHLIANGVTVQECGEWIQHCFEIECTNCHQEALRDSFNKYVFSNYCPYCGAKMMPQPPKGE